METYKLERLEKLGRILRKRRFELGLSERGFGERIGASNRTISRLEKAQVATPSVDILEKIAPEIGHTRDSLIAFLKGEKITNLPPKVYTANDLYGYLESLSREEKTKVFKYLIDDLLDP